MKPSVYLETSVVGYLTSRPSRDIIVAAQQQLTQEWWEDRRADFEKTAVPTSICIFPSLYCKRQVRAMSQKRRGGFRHWKACRFWKPKANLRLLRGLSLRQGRCR